MESDLSTRLLPLFPCRPYETQSKLATAIATKLEAGGVGIYESPTGTGKTLAVLVAASHWIRSRPFPIHPLRDESLATSILRDSERKSPSIENIGKSCCVEDDDEPDWVNEQASQASQKLEQDRMVDREKIFTEKLDRIRLASMSTIKDQDEHRSKKRRTQSFLKDEREHNSSSDESEEEVNAQKLTDTIKIYYCSRTHSQLSQVISEAQKIVCDRPLRVVALASRKQLCVNERISKESSLIAMNEKCKELQQKTSKKDRCAYLSKSRRRIIQSQIVSQSFDIEDLHKLGQRHGCCPYYGTRDSIEYAEIVAMPYNILLQKATRESYGIKLQGNCVIIDEAHNLMDAINATNSSILSNNQLRLCTELLSSYIAKYSEKFRPENYRHLQRLLSLLRLILGFFSEADESRVLLVREFLAIAKIEHFNIFEIVSFTRDYELYKKLHTTSEQSGCQSEKQENPVQAVTSFLECLTFPDVQGRLIVRSESGEKGIQYITLDPEAGFRSVLEEAHSVVLVGGTMKPVEDIYVQLLRDTHPSLITFEAFSHVIDPCRVLPLVVCEGLSGIPFDFTFQNRDNKDMKTQLGYYLANLTSIVPGGIVVFFPSHAFGAQMMVEFTSSGVLERISKKKEVFIEKPSQSNVEGLLLEYKRAIDNTKSCEAEKNGAVLFATVGGRLSEGINFSDDYGRCVVMVGLPYPNPNDPIISERIKHFDSIAQQNITQSGKQFSGSDYYENLCMKAVNQSVGRVIRHARDYAAIIFIDRRYSHPHVQQKLSSWIQNRLTVATRAALTFSQIVSFFRRHKE